MIIRREATALASLRFGHFRWIEPICENYRFNSVCTWYHLEAEHRFTDIDHLVIDPARTPEQHQAY